MAVLDSSFHYPIARGRLAEGLQSAKAVVALQKFIFKESTEQQSIDYLHFFNVGQLWTTILLLMNFYLDWLGTDISLITDMKTALRFKNIWRIVPFVDMDEWGLHVEKFGLPIMFADTLEIPEDLGRGLMLGTDDKAGPLWSQLTYYIGLAFGLPYALFTAGALNSLLNIQRIPPERLSKYADN
jgi:hypothetical protein